MSQGGALDAAARDALYRVIEARRDVRRRFLPDPVADDVLERVLGAAHRAPSVGLSQPWDFLLVTDLDLRRRVAAHVEEQRLRFSASLSGPRARHFDRLKVEAILDSPLNLVVTSTLERGGARVLGRQLQPETAAFSTCLAIENLWLAARAEGLGVGWVSIVRNDALREIFSIPENIIPVAYLCVGYAEAFPSRPVLESAEWAARMPARTLLHFDSWDCRSESDGHALGDLIQSAEIWRGLLADAAAVDRAAQRGEQPHSRTSFPNANPKPPRE